MSSTVDKAIIRAFARLDPVALGLATGTIGGVGVFASTIFLIIKGGDPVGPNLALLGQFFIGYTVSVAGALIGLFYGFVLGFALGWILAWLRNLLLSAYLQMLRTRAALTSYFESLD